MDDLRKHEPVAHILRQKTACLVGVQFRVREDPENDEKDARDGLGRYEMRSIGLDIALLS